MYFKLPKTLYYNIHGVLSICVNNPALRDYIPGISHPFYFFRVTNLKSPDIVFNIGPFKPQKEQCDVIDHRYYVKKSYLYCSEFFDNVKSECEITGIDSDITVVNINIQGKSIRHKMMPGLIAQNVFLRPLVDYKLLQKGFLSIHAAGVANGSNAYIFSGRGGTHKTTLVMDLIRKHGYRFVGEDRLIIDKDKRVYAYPIHNKIFEYRLTHMETENYKRFDKIKFLLYQNSNNGTKDYIQNKSSLKILCSIVKYNGQRVKCERISKDELIKKVIKSQQLENMTSPVIMKVSSGRMYDYLTAYAFKYPESNIGLYWENYEKLLGSILTHKKYKEIYLPQNYSLNILKELLAEIRQL